MSEANFFPTSPDCFCGAAAPTRSWRKKKERSLMDLLVPFCLVLFGFFPSLFVSYHTFLSQQAFPKKKRKKTPQHRTKHNTYINTRSVPGPKERKKILQLIYLWVGSAAVIARLATNTTTTEAGMHDGGRGGGREGGRHVRSCLLTRSSCQVGAMWDEARSHPSGPDLSNETLLLHRRVTQRMSDE